jgi:hypothetical protein
MSEPQHPESGAERIARASQAPARAATDNTSAEAHPIPVQIQADRYAAGVRAARHGGTGLRIFQLLGGRPW